MSRIAPIPATFLVLILLLSAFIPPVPINTDPLILSGQAIEYQSQELQAEYKIYLPKVINDYSGPPTIFGNETTTLDNTKVQEKSRTANVYWIRSYVFSWEAIEPINTTPSKYHWESVNKQALLEAASRKLHLIATIKMTPSWAQKYSGVSCGPIAKNKFKEFAQFLKAVVKIYGKPPYNIKYWELGNEPDVDRRLVPPDSHFGCWGEDSKTYYGGDYYADMLKVAYPAIKSADPDAQVMIGGLLLDCDPTHPPAGQTCKPGKFLEGILRNGGGDYFDVVSFHGYPYYAIYHDPLKKYPQYLYYDEHHPYWISRGGVVLGKIDFLREVMAKYDVDKPIIASEAALTCTGCSSGDPVYEEAKADYIVWLYVRNLAAEILGTTWFTIEGPGWRNAGLLDGKQNPRPAYYVLKFISTELMNTTFKGIVNEYTKLRGYQFGNKEKCIWVLWAPDEQPYKISVPIKTKVIYDKYGVPITPVSGKITVKSPVFIELPP
jgi:hypothetical protein